MYNRRGGSSSGRGGGHSGGMGRGQGGGHGGSHGSHGSHGAGGGGPPGAHGSRPFYQRPHYPAGQCHFYLTHGYCRNRSTCRWEHPPLGM